MSTGLRSLRFELKALALGRFLVYVREWVYRCPIEQSAGWNIKVSGEPGISLRCCLAANTDIIEPPGSMAAAPECVFRAVERAREAKD